MAAWAAVVLALVAVAVLPLYLSAYWLQVVLSVCALSVGTIGLSVLTGAGQLSLANPFFMAVGALTYVVLAAEPDPGGLVGLGWDPVLSAVVGVLVAGLAGLVFAPIASRLSGIYLGMASLGLVLLATHVFNNATSLSGGFNGRRTPDLAVLGVVFGRSADPVLVLGVPYGRLEWLWYVGIGCVVVAALFAANLLRSRSGRALRLLAAGEVTASVAGVDVRGAKARVFFLSSLYAGLSGVLYALSVGSIAPSTFGFDLSLQLLAMVVIGGIGSVWGAVAGTAFVVCLPLVLQSALADASALDASGISTAQLSRLLYGAAIIAVLLFAPRGLAGLWRTASAGLHRRRTASHPTESE
jgi:branched-chain amino acid transport system permease protein